MSTTALFLMIAVQGIVLGLTGYFFWRVLTAPPRPEPDSYEEE